MRLAELSRVGRVLLFSVLALVLALVLFALAEGAVRLRAILKYGYVSGVERRLMVDDATGLRIPIPGSQQGPIVINSLGFRSPEIPRAKPDGTIRLAFLGGSTTYCAEVSSNAATWPDLVTRQLAADYPQVRFDYINGGAPGYSLDNLLVNLRSRIAPLKPDLIVIYEATNDLSGNSFQLAREQGVIQARPDKERFWLSEYSLLVRLVELNLSIRSRQAAVGEAQGKLVVDPAKLAEPFRLDLERLVEESGRVAPVVAVARFSVHYRRDQPRDVQIKAADSSLYYMPYMTIETLLDGFDSYNRVIDEVATRQHALLIDGENEIPGDSVNFNDSVHFTDAGSTAMAERVARRLAAAPAVQALVAARSTGVKPGSQPAPGDSGN